VTQVRNGGGPLTTDEIGILVSSAGMAPSLHNTQPWRIEVAGHVVDVLLDPDRTLPAEDPAQREARIGLGAAAFNVRVAAAMLGYDTTFATDPDPARPEIAVRLFLGERRGRAELAELYPEIRRRHTFRGPMLDQLPAQPVLDAIADAVRREDATLVWLDSAARDRLLGIVLEADVLESHDPVRLGERSRWVGGERVHDGVPSSALGPHPLESPTVNRDLAAGLTEADRPSVAFEASALVAVLTTGTDVPADWVRAGLALQRGLLTASSLDVAASFATQPLEHPEPRRYVRELVARNGHPQMVVRLGYPAGTTGRTPRRHWSQIVQP
jgi:hypothetical protein